MIYHQRFQPAKPESMAVSAVVEWEQWPARLEIPLTKDYYESFRTTSISEPTKIPLGNYLNGNVGNGLMCPEMALPKQFCPDVKVISASQVFGGEAVVQVHAGLPGCIAPLHFDWDQSWVLHCCLSGRKRLVLLPPRAGWLLTPVVNTSALCLPRFDSDDRAELLEMLGGREILLKAGEAVLFSSLDWHCAIYDEPSVALSIRFSTHSGGRPFAVFPRSWLLQRIAAEYQRRGYGRDSADFLRVCMECFLGNCDSWQVRFGRMALAYRKQLEIMGEKAGTKEWIHDNFLPELALASFELEYYYTPSLADSPTQIAAVSEAEEYVFDRVFIARDTMTAAMALHAVNTRQGLRPRRGVVPICRNEVVHD